MRFALSKLILFPLLSSSFAQAATGPLPTVIDPNTTAFEQTLDQSGYTKWVEPGTSCANCTTVFLGTTIELETPEVQTFLRTLGDRKAELLDLYKDEVRNEDFATFANEYNELAKMAVGILGRESRFFTSTRYQIKEDFPEAVHILKAVELAATGHAPDPSPNSRGPTQIKVVPSRIAQRYGITPDQLGDPEKAAIATMGFLIESLSELHRLAALHQLTEVTPETQFDYLPYIYFGSAKSLLEHRAAPATNSYIQDMKYYMSWVEIYEHS